MPLRILKRNKRLAVRIARKYPDFKGTKQELQDLVLADPDVVGIDPILIISLVGLILNIIKFLQDRKKNPSTLLLDDDEILSKVES